MISFFSETIFSIVRIALFPRLSKSVEIEVSSGVIDSQKDKLSYPAIIKSSGILYPFSFAAYINPKHEWSLHPKIAIFFNPLSLKSRKA